MTESKADKLSPQIQIFRILWATAAIFHQVSFAGFPSTVINQGLCISSLIDVVVNFASCLVLLNPRRDSWFALLLIGILGRFTYDLPFVSNHLQLMALASLSLLLELISKRDFPLRGLRLATIVIYFFVALHKVNSGFLSITSSCANSYGSQVLSYFMPQRLLELSLGLLPIGIIFTEAALVVLLISKKYNHLGVVLGFILHFFLGWDLERRFFNFSALMFAFLFLFLPENFSQRILDYSRGNKVIGSIIRCLSSAGLRVTAAVILFVFQFGLVPENNEFLRIFCFRAIVLIWFALSLALTCLVLFFAKTKPESNILFLRPNLQSFILPIIVMVIGLGPYIGFRTRLSLDMYSNLNVDSGQSNHLFLPSLDLWGYLKDSVTIISSSDKALISNYTELNFKMVGAEFDRYLLSHPMERVTYIRGGQELSYPSGNPLKLSTISNKLISFRPLDESANARCQW